MEVANSRFSIDGKRQKPAPHSGAGLPRAAVDFLRNGFVAQRAPVDMHVGGETAPDLRGQNHRPPAGGASVRFLGHAASMTAFRAFRLAKGQKQNSFVSLIHINRPGLAAVLGDAGPLEGPPPPSAGVSWPLP
jgi:hypothetical protein